MRKWAYLDKPLQYDDERICKVMVYETKGGGTYAFLYNSPETQISIADEWYETVEEAMNVWDGLIAVGSWTEIDDPLPGCQEDCVLPIRVKGRNIGKPEWGMYELFVDGNWVAYKE